MKIKPGVNIRGIQAEMAIAALIARDVYTAQAEDLVITSGVEGTHMSGSLHYKGLALDIRLPAAQKIAAVVLALRGSLGAQFDVVLEKDHVHLEFDPHEKGGV